MDFSESELEFSAQNHTDNHDNLKESVMPCLSAENSVIETPQTFTNTEMPHILDFLPEDSVAADSFFDAFTNCEQNNNSFLTKEESITLNAVSLSQQSLISDEKALVSECFSRNRQLVCEDSMDATSREAATSSLVFTSCHLEEDEDFFLASAEETSMDSGLGSVESAYVNSEEESTPSPSLEQCSNRFEDKDVCEEGVLASTAVETFHNCVTDDNLLEKRPQLIKKRGHEPDVEQIEAPQNKVQKLGKNVSFQDVTVFYFPRKQSFVTVPSQGGSTLGMAMEHSDSQVMSLQEHKDEMKLRHKELVQEHLQEQKLENKIKQLKYLNPGIDNGTISAMARRAIGQSDSQQSSTSDDSLLENFDEFFFLQPITAKKRRKILRSAGVERIDGEEKLMNRILRESRERCGCTCEQICNPDTCECALSGIQCQVDRESFPCGCLVNGCGNVNGRIEFDSDRVRAHLLATMEKLRQIQNGSQVDFFIGPTDAEAAASSESECEFGFSDDADQSDCDAQIVAKHITFNEEDNEIETSTVTQEGSDENLQTENFQFPDENILPNEIELFEPPSTEYLNTLGLQKIEFFYENSNLKKRCGNTEDTEKPTPQLIFNCNESAHKYSHQKFKPPIPDQSLHIRSMYGTTSIRQTSPGQLISRDCSVSLDPIATFMTGTHTVSATEALPCSSGC